MELKQPIEMNSIRQQELLNNGRIFSFFNDVSNTANDFLIKHGINPSNSCTTTDHFQRLHFMVKTDKHRISPIQFDITKPSGEFSNDPLRLDLKFLTP